MQLTFSFDKKPAWQMTLAEFRQSLLVDAPLNWYGPFEFEESYDARDTQRDAYIRKEYKWAVIRARQAGEPVPNSTYAEHPILAELYLAKEPTP